MGPLNLFFAIPYWITNFLEALADPISMDMIYTPLGRVDKSKSILASVEEVWNKAWPLRLEILISFNSLVSDEIVTFSVAGFGYRVILFNKNSSNPIGAKLPGLL